jgi:hypothetical protein
MPTKLNTGKRGRPQKDYTWEIGEVYNRSRITAIVPGPRAGTGVRVEAVCLDCPKEFTARLSYLKSGKTKTCGCLKKENYKAHLAKLVAKMSPEDIAGCWEDRYSGLSRRDAARPRKIAPSTLDEAVRTYQLKLDALLNDGTAVRIYRTILLPGSDLKKIGAQYGLGAVTTQYLVKVIARKVHDNEVRKDYVATNCAWEVSNATERKTWEFGRPRELSREQLRRVKGKLIGQLAGLYRDAELLLAGNLTPEYRRDMMQFIELADDTLKNRLDRRDAKVRKIFKDRDRQMDIAAGTVAV